MSDAIIRVENLSKLYHLGQLHQQINSFRDRVRGFFKKSRGFKKAETIWALRDVSFEVKEGEVVGIIGRNGAGKSTLLKTLSRIVKPTSGHAKINGRVGSLLEVGTGFHPELTGRENIYLNGAILGMKKQEIQQKFDEIVAFAEVEKFLDTPVKRYSSGMYVRLAFAVAAHLEPDILVVDEVLAVGDVAFQKKCIGRMGEVANEGRTILFVTHNMPTVRKLCPKAILLENGRVAMIGATDSVVDRYLVKAAGEPCSTFDLPPGSQEAPGVATRLRFLDEHRKPQTEFRLWEPWRIVVEFEIFRPVPHTLVAVGLLNLDMVPIITYWSQPQDLEPGKYSVEFECTVPLKSCEIQFAVGISSYERSFYYVQEVAHVSICEIAQNDQPVRASGAGILLSHERPSIIPRI